MTRRALWGSLALALLVRLLTLGLYPVAETTEARYAEIARKMAALNDWITPWHDAGVPFWGKPPLAIWLSAGGMKFFGVNEFAARLPHFLMALAILWLLFDWLRRDGAARAAHYAAPLLAGAALFYIAAGAVMTDMALALGLMLVLRGFWRALHAPPAAARREGYAVFVGLALGLLAKGPIALVLAGVPLTLWTVLTRKLRAVRRGLPWPGGVALMLALALPWYIAAELKTPGFLDYFLIGEHWQRFTVAGWSGDRYGSAHAFARGSIWLFALAACLPWVLLLPFLAIGRARAVAAAASIDAPAEHAHARQRYLALFALTPAVFFTPAGNVLWTYVLPALPPLSVLAAEWLVADPRVRRVERTLAAGVLVTTAVFAAAIAANRALDIGNSAAPVVRAYAAHRRAAEPLLFIGDCPYSAAFYSRGRAECITDAAALRRRLKAAGPAYVALAARRRELPAELGATLSDLGAYGRYRLYVHAPPRRALSGGRSAPEIGAPP